MNIRELIKEDTDQWAAMRTALWPDCKDDFVAEINDYFKGCSTSITNVFVIELGGALIGFLELNIRAYAEGSRNSKVPYVEGWYIAPEYQGQGYGKALMHHVEKWVSSQGFSELASDAEVTNERSITVHKYLGFEETDRIVCFLKKI